MERVEQARRDFQALMQGIPLVGNLLQIDPSRIHLILENWAARYGNFYQLKIAHQAALVVSEPQVIADVLRSRPGRPPTGRDCLIAKVV